MFNFDHHYYSVINMMNNTSAIVVIGLLTAISAPSQAYLYNIMVVLKPGGEDQKGILTLLMQGKPPQRRIVNLSGNEPIPAGMNKGFGSDVDFIPANEVSGIHFCWFEMDHGQTWNGTMLLEKVIVDPEYLKDTPEDRRKLSQAFCPDPEDVPLKSWNYITLRHCRL